jgi:hypothetical protein
MKPLPVTRPVSLLLSSILALALGTPGCSDSAGPFETTTGQATTTGQESTTTGPAQTTTQAGGTTSTVPAAQFLPIGGTPIEQLTPEQGVSAYPLFEWTAVPDAARYLLFVFDTNGVMYWAWDGTATSVYLGGLDQPPTPGSMGPTLDGPMAWAVIAFDVGENLIASSTQRPITP